MLSQISVLELSQIESQLNDEIFNGEVVKFKFFEENDDNHSSFELIDKE